MFTKPLLVRGQSFYVSNKYIIKFLWYIQNNHQIDLGFVFQGLVLPSIGCNI